ncbi:MAG: S1/P1 nuclease [Porticoccaceae bacterium]
MSILKILFLCISMCVSSMAFAWGEFEHMVATDIALEKLMPSEKLRIEKDAYALLRQQETDRRLYLRRNFTGTSPLAQVSLFADTYRNLTVEELYRQFGTSVPAPFENVRQTDTSNWHYKNRPYYTTLISTLLDGAQCDLEQETDISWALENLMTAFRNAETDANRQLALAMIVHFVVDAHQPLHATTQVDEDCNTDRGGNGFCVEYRVNGLTCETNLHAYWDNAVGFFDSYETVDEAIAFVERVEVDPDQASELDPEQWLREGSSYARFIYSIKDGSGGDQFYTQDGQVISYQRLALAAERLARILEDLY